MVVYSRIKKVEGDKLMAKLISVQLDKDTKIYLETADICTLKKDPLFEEAGASDWVIDKTKEYFDKVLSQIKVFSSSVADSIKNISDEVEVEFSVKLAADAGVVISSVSTEASITVKLKWEKPKNGG